MRLTFQIWKYSWLASPSSSRYSSLTPRAPGCGSSSRTARSEEHTSELQSQSNLVCRLLLEKEKHTSELQSQSNLVCRLLLEKKKQTSKIHLHTKLECSLLF